MRSRPKHAERVPVTESLEQREQAYEDRDAYAEDYDLDDPEWLPSFLDDPEEG